MDTESGDSADQAAHSHTVQGQTVRLMVRLTPASSVPVFHARVSGERRGAPMEFSDAAFVRFLQRIAEWGPGLK